MMDSETRKLNEQEKKLIKRPITLSVQLAGIVKNGKKDTERYKSKFEAYIESNVSLMKHYRKQMKNKKDIARCNWTIANLEAQC